MNNENYTDWQRGLDRKRAVANLFYASMFAIVALAVLGGIAVVVWTALTLP